jgi:hypothetical protein
MAVSERIVKDRANVSPKLTEVMVVKEVPWIVTVVPVPALVGENTLTVGAGGRGI